VTTFLQDRLSRPQSAPYVGCPREPETPAEHVRRGLTVVRSGLTSVVVELRQLRYFVAVAEARHFGRAARRLHISTSSLSQQIRVLERDLRVVLFDRTSRGVVLTSAGRVLLEHARALLSRAQLARDHVRCSNGRREQLAVRVASGAQLIMGETVRGLSSRMSTVDVSTALCPDSDATQAVRQERADAAIVWTRSVEDQDLGGVTLRRVPVRLAVPISHRLAVAACIPTADLIDETVVLFPRDLAPGLWDRLVSHLVPAWTTRSGRVLIDNELATDGQAALLNAVAAGRGVAPIVSGSVDGRVVNGITVRPITPPLTVQLELVWNEPPRPALRELVMQLAER
jgi:DNA-binding transcriptional LysR family regulator